MKSNIKDYNKGILVIYTGGTIVSMPKDPNAPDSPMVVVDWETYKKLTTVLGKNNIGFRVDGYSIGHLDSCNIGPKECKEMVDVFKDNYDDYEGFVILHETDTMVYTESVLSFIFNDFAKPVIITGAQLAYPFNLRNDGFHNMITSILVDIPKYSQFLLIPEVCIYFNGKLLRRNRCRKLNASAFESYQSPIHAPLGNAGESIQIDICLIQKIQRLALIQMLLPSIFFPTFRTAKSLKTC